MSERKEVYVLGHRNPDTDSICSAIAYADVKNKENDGNHYVAARAGQISSETSYVLQRFGMRQPTYVNNIGTRVRDMEIRKIPGINEGISMKKAWSMMAEMNAVTLPIVDANNVLDGIITINDIATSYMENQDSTMIAKAKTPYCNILETLEAKMLVGDPDAVFEHGNVVIAVANPDVMENYIEKDDMVITGNRYESQLSAIESGAGCILVCLGAEVSRSIQKLARDNNCAVLITPLDTYTVAHRISQCMPVKAFMRTKDLVTFTPSDYTDAIKDTMQNTLEYGGKFYVCGTGRQPILRNKTENDNYYLLTLAAIAREIKQRGENTECSITLAAGLPLAGFGREKKSFREYLLRSSQLVCFKFEGVSYKITIEDVKLFPQGYSAIAIHPELIQNEPSVLLMDIGGWTVDLMRLDNGVPDASTCRSLELGMIRCIDETKEQVRRDVGLSVTDAQVERVLAGKPCSMDERARSIIRKQGRLYTERLLSAVMDSGFDLKAVPVVMLGGGASVVKGNVSPQDGLCRVFALTDDRVNAEGFERILGQFSGGLGKG